MGVCAERGEDRPNWRVLWRSECAQRGCGEGGRAGSTRCPPAAVVPWLLLGELAIFGCGLFWMPFGIAIHAKVDPSAICPASQGAGKCLDK